MTITFNNENGLWYNDQSGEWLQSNPEASSAPTNDYSGMFGPGFEWMQPYAEQYIHGIDTELEKEYARAHQFGDNLVTSTPYEALSYWGAGVQNQQNLDTFAKAKAGQSLTPLESMLVDNPGTAGQSVVRPDIPNPYAGVQDPASGDNPAGVQAIYDEYGVKSTDYSAAASGWASNNTAAAQAARSDDDGMGVFGVVLTIAAMVLAPYAIPAIAGALGVSNIAAAAIFGGAKALLTGGDIGDVAMGAVTGGLGAEFLGGAGVSDGGAFDMGGSAGVFDSSGMPLYQSPSDPGTMISAAGMSDVPQGLQGAVSGPETTGAFDQYGSLASPATQASSQTIFDPAAAPPAPPAPSIVSNMMDSGAGEDFGMTGNEGAGPVNADKGMVGGLIDWAKNNQTLASSAIMAGAGILKGIGDRANATEMQKLKNQGSIDQINATTQAKEDYLAYLRSLPGWSGKLGVKAPTSARPLRRPDGSLVFSPAGGLITGQMGG